MEEVEGRTGREVGDKAGEVKRGRSGHVMEFGFCQSDM